MNTIARIEKVLSKRQNTIDPSGNYLPSAIMVPLIKTSDGLSMLFEVRAATLKRQPGEICFPGGKIEKNETPRRAAVRETEEELGISARDIHVLGCMDGIIAPIGVILYPWVAVLPGDIVLNPNKSEVAEVFAVPLKVLAEQEPLTANMELATRPTGSFPLHLVTTEYKDDWNLRRPYQVLFYLYKEWAIWGMTARVVEKLLKRMNEYDKRYGL